MTMDKGEIRQIVSKLEKSNPTLSKCVERWIPLLYSTVSKISHVTGRSAEDALQDILVAVSEVYSLHGIPLYRYKRRVYEKVDEDGCLYCLKTPRVNKRDCYWVWVPAEDVQPVKRGKLESEIYREINQQARDIMEAHFRKRNGYVREPAGTMKVRDRDSEGNVVYREKASYNIKKTVNFVELEDDLGREFIKDSSWGVNPEDQLIYKRYINSIRGRLSEKGRTVLRIMMNHPTRSNTRIAGAAGLSLADVEKARDEIMVVVMTQLYSGCSNMKWSLDAQFREY